MSSDTVSSMALETIYNPSNLLTCHFCGLSGSLRCAQCKQIHYCSVDCQKKDWQIHSNVCNSLRASVGKVEYNVKSLDKVEQKRGILSTISKQTKEHNKKTINYHLNTWRLQKNTKIQGTLKEFSNPTEFYIQINCPDPLITAKLKDYRISQNEYIPSRGDLAAVKYSVTQIWCRGLVKEVDTIKKSALVLYIDYGRKENVLLSDIKELPRDVAQFPPCAIKCCIPDFLPTKEEWKANCNTTFAQIPMGKHCILTVIDVLKDEMPYFAVDVVFQDSGKHLCEIISEMECGMKSKENNSIKESSATGRTMEKSIIQDQNSECKGIDQIPCPIPQVILLHVGDEFLGMVSHIQSPEEFYCQQAGNARKLFELQVSLQAYCGKFSTCPDFHPVVGDLCCAQFTGDNQWYRVSLLTCISNSSFVVGYVDYGNVEVLQLNKLRPIIPELMELPVQAIRCALAGIKPVSGTWSSKATSTMKKLVNDKVIGVRVINKNESSFVVELTDASMSPTQNVSKCLLELGYATEEAISGSTAPEITVEALHSQSPNKASWIALSVKQVVTVVVCVVYHPSKFYCQLLNNDDLIALEELNVHLGKYCRKTAPGITKITKGEVCCAYFSGDSQWYRAVAKETSSSEAIKVLFVDYGNCEKVSLDKIRQIPFSFMKLPFQAVKCWLAGVQPISKKWTMEAIAAFQMCTTGKRLQATVVSLTANGAEVELVDNSTNTPIVISEILINKHLAFKKEISISKTTMSSEFPHRFEEHLEWKTTLLPVDESVSVQVLGVVTPSLFYVVPTTVKVNPQRLRELMSELGDYCNSQSDNQFKPRVGEPCCAKFTGDNNWYRAVVLEISELEVKVAYADYGNIEMLPFSRLLPITTLYLELPFIILKCSLSGITKLDGNWSVAATAKLRSLLLNECVIITVKDVKDSIHVVTVQKKSENGILNIAEQLVLENLAHYSNSGNQCEVKNNCCCSELRAQVVKLEKIIYFLLKDRFGEAKLPGILKSLEG